MSNPGSPSDAPSPETPSDRSRGDGDASPTSGRRARLGSQLLILLVVLSVGPLFVTNLVGYLTSRNDTVELSLASLRRSGDVAALQTEQFLEDSRRLVASIVADNHDLIDSTRRAASRSDSTSQPAKRALEQHLAAKADESSRDLELFVATPDGELLASSTSTRFPAKTRAGKLSPQPRGPTKEEREHPCSRRRTCRVPGWSYLFGAGPRWVLPPTSGPSVGAEALGAERPRASRSASQLTLRSAHFPDTCADLVQSDSRSTFRRDDGAIHYFLVQPFPSNADEPVGLLCARFPFGAGRLAAVRDASEAPAETVSLVDGNGEVLARQGHGTGIDGTRLAAPLTDHLGAGSHWSGRFEVDDGATGFAALRPVGESPWSVATTISREDALASLVALRRRVTWLGGGLLVAVLLGIGFTVRKTVGPIEDLVDAVRDMRHGALDQQVQVRGPREVASLADAFNDMSDRVVDLRDELEQRVRQRTRELEQSQAFTELLFDSMRESLVVVDDTRKIVKANSAAEKLYGADLEGTPCWRAFEDRDEPCDACPVDEVLESNESVDVRRVHACRDGPEIVDLEGFPLPERQGEPERRVLLVGRVVTEETREEQQLIHQEKMAAVGVLSAGMAHEIGNPLASIESQLQTARRLDDPEVTEETLDVIEQEVDRIQDLLRSVSSFARRRDTTEAPLSLNRIVEDVARLLEHDPRGRDVELDFDLEESLPAVRADENRLLQVLLNLGLNAFAALDESGTVRIETFGDDETVAVRVRDTGPGVPSSIRDRIFEPYFTTKSDDEGTGLGLFVSRRIVRDLGGELELEEPADHRGASFVVRLPRHGTDEAPSSSRPAGEEHDHD